MSGAGFEIYGNVGALQSLAGEEQGYVSRFGGIMSTIDSHAKQTLSQWEGAGTTEFTQLSTQYNAHFQSVLSSFAKLVDATDGASQNYARLVGVLSGMF
ncbi:WXG100 family type VII secretion target [Nakamurella sp.]|uniref:WXG100 family type VII secretion target n=1 Tax=Nakamurella sp. TaxID=1869182 RepID=UPI003784ECDA